MLQYREREFHLNDISGKRVVKEYINTEDFIKPELTILKQERPVFMSKLLQDEIPKFSDSPYNGEFHNQSLK